ncbi:hypothetical protein CRYO30217_01786 [Parvicella tangerina]|uniref:Uncharacterized protein n=1 Tax=Parvicella tangerina TaxID=2829795 RepID=A0A916JM11_9FLAO|nr:hypothetical protein CRYO30217_01786 [Parvicella tangerina]
MHDNVRFYVKEITALLISPTIYSAYSENIYNPIESSQL